MKKIFFQKLSSSYRGEKSRDRTDKNTVSSQNAESKFKNSEQFFPVCDRKVSETKTMSKSSGFRRSRSLSMSSGAIDRGRLNEDGLTRLRNTQRFPSSHTVCDCSDCQYQLTDRNSKPERYTLATTKRQPTEVLYNQASSSPSIPNSPRNSFNSNSISDQMLDGLDLYMDDNDIQENKLRTSNHRPCIPSGLHNRFFVEKSNLFIPSQNTSTDSLKSENQHESPRKLAKHVVERLLRLEQFRDLDGKGCTVKDILDEDTLSIRNKSSLLDREYVTIFPVEKSNDIVEQKRENDKLQSRLRREFESEEYRVKDRIREVEDQNVTLQREISSFHNKEKDYIDKLSQMELNLNDQIGKLNEVRSENDNLQKKLKISEEVQSCLERNFREKEKENTELIKAASRVQVKCREQERTIDGLRQCLNLEIDERQSSGTFQNVTHKLQLEQSRLTEVEQALRKQLETCMVEIQSLRTENVYLLDRLKNGGKVNGRSGVKLDLELVSWIHWLKNMGLSLLNECVQICEELVKIIGKTDCRYDMKVQGLKQGLEQLTRSLGKASFVLMDKSELDNHELDLSHTENSRLKNMNPGVMEKDDLRHELQAESLLTSILKEKLFFKEKEVERVQAELARVLLSNDVLKSENQDAFETVSCLNHKMKKFELQDRTINQLQGEARSLEQELGTTKSILSKVTQERDFMWEEVKQYSEKNMLLNRELNDLKKKIDALEEETLLKEGQISILKDSLSNARSFDVLFGVEQGELFRL